MLEIVRLRWWVGLLSLAVLAGLWAASQIGHVQSADARLEECGGTNPANRVAAAFELSHASEFWDHFPLAPRGAPELEVDTPVYVVVFEGPTAVAVLGQMPGPEPSDASYVPLETVLLNDVVCVYMPPSAMYPEGEPLVYYNVPRAGFVP
jgi:hypothetical protein